MKKFLALLCILVFVVGSAMCESQVPLEDNIIIEESTEEPTSEPTPEPTPESTPEPIATPEPTPEPTEVPTEVPTEAPTEEPTSEPTEEPVIEATVELTDNEPDTDIISDEVEFEEGDWGEVTVNFKREVYISFLREPKAFGDTVTLVATLVNFEPDDRYTLSWQYSEDGKNWTSIAGEDERTYTFIVDEVNCHYYYRVSITLDEE